MLKSYLPSRFNTWALISFILLWTFDYRKSLLIAFFIYLFLYLVLRRSRTNFRDDLSSTRGVIFSPVNGKIIHIEQNVSHGIYGEGLTEIQFMIPWWKEMGIFLPLTSEIKDLLILRGRSFFRMFKADESIGTNQGKGVALTLDNRGEIVGLSFLKCLLGMWPELIIMAGDKGGRRVNIGYFPFGGTVMLYLPKKYEILINKEDQVIAGETICAVLPEKEKGN